MNSDKPASAKISNRDWSATATPRYAGYRSSATRDPAMALVRIPQTVSEQTGPRFDAAIIGSLGPDLTRNSRRNGEPVGERIIVTGRILDDAGRPIAGALVELWQANAAGRYVHLVDQHDAPLDPNFLGAGRCLSDAHGRYTFTTIRPGAYPWGNHENAWRPAHLHFSVFGHSMLSRLVTQMYFPGDPLLPHDPIYNSVEDPEARQRMVASFSFEHTVSGVALGYEFDMVMRG
ncbi:MAG: protocatechuate 3,4-dioxygenase subunit beta [Gammaproteobacteria bacterium]|nr:protocatechuate 3,4-dioxygenase subunit beta [Gammaproteobacteria bacterium]